MTHKNAAGPPSKTRPSISNALRVIAIFEFLKGLAALLAAIGAIDLMHRDVRRLAIALIGRFGLSQDGKFPSLLLHYADLLPNANITTMLVLALAYVTVRWVEAFGLWTDRSWGEWVAALSAGLYIPFEGIHLIERPTAINAAVILVNMLMIGFLSYRLWRRRLATVSHSFN